MLRPKVIDLHSLMATNRRVFGILVNRWKAGLLWLGRASWLLSSVQLATLLLPGIKNTAHAIHCLCSSSSGCPSLFLYLQSH